MTTFSPVVVGPAGQNLGLRGGLGVLDVALDPLERLLVDDG